MLPAPASNDHKCRGLRHGYLAWKALPAGCDLRRQRRQLRDLLRGGRQGRALPDRRRRLRDPARAGGGRRLRLARLRAERAAGHPLRLPRARPVRPGERPPEQPVEAAARPLRQGHRRPDRRRRVALQLPLRRPGRVQRGRLARPHDALGGDQPVLRLGPRPPAAARVPRDRLLRDARQGSDHDPPRRARRRARHLRRHRPPGDHRAPHLARGHRGRAAARAPVRQRLPPRRPGSVELLGLQHHRVPGPAQRLRQLAGDRRRRPPSSRRW